MPKASVLQSSFSSGEISPLFYGQADNPRYKKALQSAINILPLLQGPVISRPGTKFSAQAKVTGSAPVLIPFKFSQTQAYMLEFGNNYIRFYANNAQILTTGTTFILTGTPLLTAVYTDPVRGVLGQFYASRAASQLQVNETFIAVSTSVPTNTILELPSPYKTADLQQIQFCQSADTLYLFHPNYPIYKLQRQAQTYWELFPVQLKDGPYLALNTYKTFGDMSNFVVGTLPTGPQPDLNGVYGNIIESNAINITNAITDPGGSGQIQITTTSSHGLFTGQNVYISGVVGTIEANNWPFAAISQPAYWPITVTSTTTFLLQGSVFVHAYGSGGTEQPAVFAQESTALRLNTITPNSVLQPDVGRLISIVNTGMRYYAALIHSLTAASHEAISIIPMPNGVLATSFQFGVYSPGFGFPTCGCFHQNRLVLGGPGVAPQEVDGSVVGEFENFAASNPANLQVSDSNAYSFQLNSSDANVINWLASTSFGLLAGTLVSDWCITPDSASAALTPTNFNAQQSSFFGSAKIQPVQIANSTIYIQGSQRKVREMSFFFAAGTFRSIEMTELSEHITIPTVTKLAVSKETQPLVWVVRSDGALISMIFNRDDQSLIAGWTRHFLGGQSDSSGTPPIVSSIAVIPSPDITFDQMWCVVQRYINGAIVYYIEYMTKIFDDSVLQEDAFQIDCGATFYNPLTITGISTANPAVLTFTGGSFSNGDRVKITGVIGLNKSTTDANSNVTISNLVNEQFFTVAGVSGFTFQLNDENGNPISSIGYSAYVSGGSVAKCVTTISGLTWLENETLTVLADGAIQPNVVVSNTGQVTLQNPAAKVQLGYPYNYQAMLLRADAGSPDGTSIGKTRRTTRLAVQLHRSCPISLGTSFKNLIPVSFDQADFNQADYLVPLFSGMIREGLESAYDFESQPCIQGSSPLPMCIQSVTSFMEEFDV